jgi:hypothetical protein
MDDLKYHVFKARLIKIATAIEEHKSMHEKPLLRMYQSSRHSKQEGERKKVRRSAAHSSKKSKEHTRTTKGDREKKFQSNCEALAGVPQSEINQYKADKASCWRCGMNSHHTLECFAKKTSKGTELATTVAVVSQKGKRQRPMDESDDEDDQAAEPPAKRPNKVATMTQTARETSPQPLTKVWEVKTSDSDLN